MFVEPVFMTFPIENQTDVVVALDLRVAQSLNPFVDDCLNRIYEQHSFSEI